MHITYVILYQAIVLFLILKQRSLVEGCGRKKSKGPKPKPTPGPEFVACFECFYSAQKNRKFGHYSCMDPFNATAAYITARNCTGFCEKSWTRLDDETYSITRQCVPHCYEYEGYGDRFSKCCRKDNCNSAPQIMRETLRIQGAVAALHMFMGFVLD